MVGTYESDKPLKRKHPDVVLEKVEDYNKNEKEDEKMIYKLIVASWNILGIKLNVVEVKRLFSDAKKLCETRHGISEALLWAKDFKLPFDISRRDIDGLKLHGGDLTAYVKSLHKRDEKERFSLDRVEKFVPHTDPDYFALCRLVKGIPIFTTSTFKPNNGMVNGKPMRLRKKHLMMPSVINKLVYELYKGGKVVILPTDVSRENRTTHFSALSWTVKFGKPQGRLIGDTSATESGTPLNSLDVKEMFDKNFGNIHHPTIIEIARMVFDEAERIGWSNAILWKMDLKGAFTLLYVLPEDVSLLAFELTNNLTVMHHTGMFGYTGMPGCFDVISRVLCRNLRKLLHGKCLMYVDDIIAVSHIKQLEKDLKTAVDYCEGLLGPAAVEKDKTEFGRSLDVIGWNICLDTKKIGIARKNMLKTFYGLVTLNETLPVTLEELQRIASWAARYSLVCRQLRPFTRALYSCIQHYTNKHVRIKLSDDAANTIQMWRSFFVFLEINPITYKRDIISFVHHDPSFVLEYDASLTGVGIILFKLGNEKEEKEWKVIQLEFHYNLESQSRYQNTVEFIGIVLGMVALSLLGVRNSGVIIRGDNKSSLKWGLTENYKSILSRRASLVLTTVVLQTNIIIEDQIHIAGINNIRCDRLSRQSASPED